MTFRRIEEERGGIIASSIHHHDLRLGDVVSIRPSSILEFHTTQGACIASGTNIEKYFEADVEHECVLRADLGWHTLPPRQYKINVVDAVLVGRQGIILIDVAFAKLVLRDAVRSMQ